MQVAVSYEGVLTTVSGSPVQAGVDLVRAISLGARVVMFGEASLEKMETFVGVHNLNRIADIRSGTERPGDEPLLRKQIDEFRADGIHIDVVIHPDPNLVSWLIKQRIPGLMFTEAEVTPPAHRPDDVEGLLSWSHVVEEYEKREKSKKVSMK